MLLKIKKIFLKRTNKGIARRKKQLDLFLTEAHGPIGSEKRDEYEKLRSGKLFRAKHFKVIAYTELFSLEL